LNEYHILSIITFVTAAAEAFQPSARSVERAQGAQVSQATELARPYSDEHLVAVSDSVSGVYSREVFPILSFNHRLKCV
jgi:hypothetical protein